MIRGLWDRETVALLVMASVLPIAGAWLLAGGGEAVLRRLTALAVVAVWQLVFLLARAQAPSLSALPTALAVAVLLPPELDGPAFLLSLSFGIVFGELVFGGWGRNVLNPATVTLAFAGFGFPAAAWPDLPVQVSWAAVPASLLGASLGVFPWRLLAGAAAVFAGAWWLLPEIRWAGEAGLFASGWVVLALLVADPVAGPHTRGGAWAAGALYAALATWFHLAWGGAAAVQSAVSAALLASLAAPLLDELAVAAWIARRRRRLG
jgi:Na+-transporting NADH:ubiquinone oxidoreductase subunit B